MTHASSHTHCQVAQADTQAKTWQRVCLFQRTADRKATRKTEGQHPTAVWRNGGGRGKLNSSFSNQLLCLVDNEVLRNPPLRQAAKRYRQA